MVDLKNIHGPEGGLAKIVQSFAVHTLNAILREFSNGNSNLENLIKLTKVPECMRVEGAITFYKETHGQMAEVFSIIQSEGPYWGVVNNVPNLRKALNYKETPLLYYEIHLGRNTGKDKNRKNR